MVEALTRAGRTDKKKLEQARLMFEQMLTYANHLGLYAEETGPHPTSNRVVAHFAGMFKKSKLIKLYILSG